MAKHAALLKEDATFKIVVPTEEDRRRLVAALEYLHFADINTDFPVVNHLVHGYLNEGESILVDPEVFSLI